jgi:hypothetical protein
MSVEQISLYLPLIKAAIWGIVVVISVILLRKELREIFQRLTGTDEVELNLQYLSIQAKTMRELQRSLDIGFTDLTVSKAELSALVETKLKSIQAAMEHTLSKSDLREGPRLEVNQPIKIKSMDGRLSDGFALDISEAGIGFKSGGRLNFHEIVEILPADPENPLPTNDHSQVRIVRVEQASEGYYYGASVHR